MLFHLRTAACGTGAAGGGWIESSVAAEWICCPSCSANASTETFQADFPAYPEKYFCSKNSLSADCHSSSFGFQTSFFAADVAKKMWLDKSGVLCDPNDWALYRIWACLG